MGKKLMVVVYICTLIMLITTHAVRAFTITYTKGPYDLIDILVVPDASDARSMLEHAKNRFGLKEDAYIAEKVVSPVAGIGLAALGAYGAGHIASDYADPNSISSIATYAGGGMAGGAIAGGLAGSLVGKISKKGVSLTSDAIFNFLKKFYYHADYIEDVGLGTVVVRTKSQMSSSNLLRQDLYGNSLPVYLFVIVRDKKNLTLIGRAEINPCRSYYLSIDENEIQGDLVTLTELPTNTPKACL